MGEMAIDHGSELHLLRYMGRHRRLLDESIAHLIGAEGKNVKNIKWLDVPFDPKNRQKDGEWKSVDFLQDAGGDDWKRYWPDRTPGKPNRTGMPSWDAVVQMNVGNKAEWLLVEAKAHIAELANPRAKCGAGGNSRKKIEKALQKTYEKLTGDDRMPWADVAQNWLGIHYQKANRLACQYFLNEIKKESTRLLYIYFVGDSFKDSPKNPTGWHDAINRQYEALGLRSGHVLKTHELFLNVLQVESPVPHRSAVSCLVGPLDSGLRH
ncbi:MAG: hypothetical protein NTW14_12620 [bacterium]|nr:hypothetical protein [bacterium]